MGVRARVNRASSGKLGNFPVTQRIRSDRCFFRKHPYDKTNHYLFPLSVHNCPLRSGSDGRPMAKSRIRRYESSVPYAGYRRPIRRSGQPRLNGFSRMETKFPGPNNPRFTGIARAARGLNVRSLRRLHRQATVHGGDDCRSRRGLPLSSECLEYDGRPDADPGAFEFHHERHAACSAESAQWCPGQHGQPRNADNQLRDSNRNANYRDNTGRAIGNAQAITIVRTTWISTDLKVPVEVKSNDPRSGSTDMELTNIQESRTRSITLHGALQLHSQNRRCRSSSQPPGPVAGGRV